MANQDKKKQQKEKGDKIKKALQKENPKVNQRHPETNLDKGKKDKIKSTKL